MSTKRERRESLIAARKAAGHSQYRLARELHVDHSTVVRWESGETEPQPWNRPALARALHITTDHLTELLATGGRSGRAPHVDDVLTQPDRVDLVTVAELREAVYDLGLRYDEAPSTSLLAETGQCLGQVAFLASYARRGRVRRELCAVEAEAATLMGQLVWDASQRRDHVTARAYYDQAIRAARQLRDPVAEAHALLRTSFVALYGERDPNAGLALAERTADVSHTNSRVLAGLALLHAAEAHAMLGDRRACEQALAAAQHHFDRIDQADVASDLFSETQFDRLAGSCYLFLGDHARAQTILERSAQALQDRRKSRAIVLGNLTLAHIRQANLDGAASTLHDAIDVLEQTRGGGGLTVVFSAGRELVRWRTEPVVQDVYDRLLALIATE